MHGDPLEGLPSTLLHAWCPAEGSAYTRTFEGEQKCNQNLAGAYLSLLLVLSLVYGRKRALVRVDFRAGSGKFEGAFGPIHMQRGAHDPPSFRQKVLINERTAVMKQVEDDEESDQGSPRPTAPSFSASETPLINPICTSNLRTGWLACRRWARLGWALACRRAC